MRVSGVGATTGSRATAPTGAGAAKGASGGGAASWHGYGPLSRHRIFAQAISIAHYTSLREVWATVPLDRQRPKHINGAVQCWPFIRTGEMHMNITTAQVKEIRTELAKLQPEKVTLAGNRTLSVKETVFALAPTLERMKKRGFDIQEIAEKLHEKGIEVVQGL